MSKVIFDMAVSIDGYTAGADPGPANPLGDNGTSLHTWMYPQKAFLSQMGMTGGEDGEENKLVEEVFARTGAYIMGKRMFEEGEVHWPEDLYKADVYVLTHEAREPWKQKGSTTFYFINDGISSALAKAKQSAKGKDIRIQGGANVVRQFLNAGLIDECIIHVSPVVLGSGTRLFDELDKNAFRLEILETITSRLVTHTRYKVLPVTTAR